MAEKKKEKEKKEVSPLVNAGLTIGINQGIDALWPNKTNTTSSSPSSVSPRVDSNSINSLSNGGNGYSTPTNSVYPVGTAENGGQLMSDGSVRDPSTGATTGQWVQGIGGGIQVIQGAKQWKDGDKVGGGLNVAAGGANIAASMGSQTAGSIAPWINGALAAYDIKKTLASKYLSDKQKNQAAQYRAGLTVADYFTFGGASALNTVMRSNKTTRKFMEKLDRNEAKFLNPVLMLSNSFLSSKDQDQVLRDNMRKEMKKSGAVDDKFNYTFKDGSTSNVGLDGGGRLKNVGTNIDGKADRGGYDVDFSNKLSGDTVNRLDALSTLLLGRGEGKQRSDLTGLNTNAALEKAKDMNQAMDRVKQIYAKNGFDTKEKAQNQLNSLKEKLDEKQFSDTQNSLNALFGGGSPAVKKPQQPGQAPAPQRQQTQRQPPLGLDDILLPEPTKPDPVPQYEGTAYDSGFYQNLINRAINRRN